MSMRRRNRKRREGAKASIDMNSLIDLTFLLLVVFIVTLPTLEQTVKIILPSDKIEKREDQKLNITTVTVDSNGRLFIGDKPVTHDDFKALVQRGVMEDPDKFAVVIRGDVRASYGDVYNVFKIVKDCNAKNLSLASQEN